MKLGTVLKAFISKNRNLFTLNNMQALFSILLYYILFYKLFSPMVLLVWFCVFHFHISEVLNNETIFTDDISPKLPEILAISVTS